MNFFRPRDDSHVGLSSRVASTDGYNRLQDVRNVLQERPAGFLHRLLKRKEEDPCDNGVGDKCQTATGTNVTTLAIVLGIIIPAVVAVIVLIFLHRRNIRKVRLEDATDAHRDLDFGMEFGTSKKGGRKSMLFGGEKQSHRPGQLSMDMNLSSPYLLPPAAQQSQDSIQSLARTFHDEPHDPYRTVYQYANSEAGSMSGYNSKTGSVAGRSMGTPMIPPPRTNSMPKSPSRIASTTNSSVDEKSNPFATPTAPEPAHKSPVTGEVHDSMLPVQPIVPEIGNVAYPDDKLNEAGFEIPDVQSPPPVISRNPDSGLPSPPEDMATFELPPVPHMDNNLTAAHGEDTFQGLPEHQHDAGGLRLDIDMPTIMHPPEEDASVYDQAGYHGDQPQIQTSQYYEDYEYDGDHHPQQDANQQQGLGVPIQENKRLSVGFRPLPPDEVTESEDPEYRANRIRSFYKEYFDDSKDPAPPMPGQHADYYEDYDENYLGDAAYYDADTNAFVMPYAQPVTRRAMTPPPSGRNRGLPGRGPRGPHGSIGGMSMPGGPRNRPRAGSAFGPRPGSSASARLRQPRKKGPPPAALTTLPTPSKLKDDSFSVLNPIDFAPPELFKDKATGRSQSPLGERRPFQQPKIPVASPLVTAFDEMASLPSPHVLRKSSTFTGLDFAPPKKFNNMEGGASDAGSIKSSRSGISAMQLGAIRAGAGRISRLPGDTVFTQAAINDQLKPQWNLRQY